LPQGTYLAFLSLEWTDDAEKRAKIARELTHRVPEFAPAWQQLSSLVEDDTEKLALLKKGLAARPDAETKGMLEINKALILDRQGDHEGAVRLLGQLALDPQSTFATEHMAKVTLAEFLKNR